MTNADRISELYRGEAGRLDVQARARRRVDWLVRQARGRVLEIGCSQGIVSILCAREGHRVLGVDLEEDRIATARADLDRKPPEVRERVEFRVGDATALDLPDDAFDTVLVGEVLEHLTDPGAVLAEASRVAVPGGVIAITTPLGYAPHHDHHQTFYLASLVDAVASHLTIESAAIEDGYFRLVASPGPMDPARARDLIVDAQRELERALVEQQKDHLRTTRRIRSRLRHQRELARDRARELRRARRRARRLRRRLAALERTRSARVGKALARARSPRRLLGLPVALGRALRKLPPPAEPRPEASRTAPTPVEAVPPPQLATAEAVAGADGRLRVELPEAAPLPSGPVARPGLRVATILDRFSAAAFRYEWEQVEVGPHDWRERLAHDPPELLFVESAWKGNDDRWAKALVGRGSGARELRDLVAWCRDAGVPTVFWNKEDPPHFSTFVDAARLFDHVLTTDSNRLGPYREVLGREEVGVLEFGAQPRIHNPVAVTGGRRHPVAFAGTFFQTKHPRRRVQMEMILGPARDFGLHIFSRVASGERPEFEWPEEYRPHVVGSLPYERMITAYKAYRLFLNVNTIVDSPTMCARRAFEISATGTPLLSGDSLALREVFGERIAIATDSGEAREQLELLLGDPELAARRGHAAMRHVLAEHTYGHRVDEVLRVAGLEWHVPPDERPISVAVALDSAAAPVRLFEELAAQTGQPLELLLAPCSAEADVTAAADTAARAGLADARALAPAEDRAAALNGAAHSAAGALLAVVDPGCSYGEHFLGDLAAAFAYTDAAVIGKAVDGSGAPIAEHAYGAQLHPASLLVRAEVAREVGFGGADPDPGRNLLAGCAASGRRAFAADRYSFEPVAALSRD